ncbi:MAG: hypothetical protein PUB21_11075 [Bacteroidales bacterium]|nr:hypothetical protein [Bacteroidales bacterium]
MGKKTITHRKHLTVSTPANKARSETPSSKAGKFLPAFFFFITGKTDFYPTFVENILTLCPLPYQNPPQGRMGTTTITAAAAPNPIYSPTSY